MSSLVAAHRWSKPVCPFASAARCTCRTTAKVRSKPKRRGLTKGRSRAWKKAIVQLAPGERIELFEGAETA